MAWERSFEKRVLKIRERELEYQKLNYSIEVRGYEILTSEAADTSADALERDLEWLADLGHARRILALRGVPRPGPHSVHCLHLYQR